MKKFIGFLGMLTGMIIFCAGSASAQNYHQGNKHPHYNNNNCNNNGGNGNGNWNNNNNNYCNSGGYNYGGQGYGNKCGNNGVVHYNGTYFGGGFSFGYSYPTCPPPTQVVIIKPAHHHVQHCNPRPRCRRW